MTHGHIAGTLSLLSGLLLSALILISPVYGQDEVSKWTATDTALQVTYTAFHVMDWMQTLHIARNPGKFEEEDPLVTPFVSGRHPSTGRINALCATTLVLQTLISYELPKPYRTIWQGLWIGIEAKTVSHNRQIGLGISLHF